MGVSMSEKQREPHHFSDFIQEYDQAINWGDRFERESSFFKLIFTKNKVKSVLDCACSSGRHSQMFADWGLKSVGTDKDPLAIDYARELARASNNSAQFSVAELGHLKESLETTFDAITILGNGLAFLPDFLHLEEALRDAYETLNTSGVVITQIVNFDYILDRKIMPLRYRTTEKRNTLFVRYYEKIDHTHSSLNVIVLQQRDTKWEQKFFTFPILNIDISHLNHALEGAGFREHHHYGSYDLQPFSSTTPTLLSIAHKK